MSWPRSSVPNTWAHEGALSLARKSISSIGTRYASGPSRTAPTMTPRTRTPTIARRCRRKRRPASSQRESDLRAGARTSRPATASDVVPFAAITRSSERDPGVQPAIDEVGDQPEDEDQRREDERHAHDDRRVVGQDRADE